MMLDSIFCLDSKGTKMWGNEYDKVAVYISRLNAIGVHAKELAWEDPEAPRHSLFAYLTVGTRQSCIKVLDRNIQYIELWTMSGKGGSHMTIAYLVRANIGDDEKDLDATWSAPISSYLRSGLKDYGWKGGLLAQSLNLDLVLKDMLMPYQRALKVRARAKNQYVAFHENLWDLPFYPHPELPHFETMDRIARHIRMMAPSIS